MVLEFVPVPDHEDDCQCDDCQQGLITAMYIEKFTAYIDNLEEQAYGVREVFDKGRP